MWVAAGITALVLTLVAQGCHESSTATPEAVASVTVTPPMDSIVLGNTRRFTARLECIHGDPLDRPVAWRTSDANVAFISDGGDVTTLAAGMVIVSALSEDKLGTATLYVLAPAAILRLTPERDTLLPGDKIQFTTTLLDADGNALRRHVSWTSSDPAVVTLDAQGLATAVGVGTATVTARHETLAATATVVVRAPVASVSVFPATSSLLIGATLQLTAQVRDAGGDALDRPVTWVSADPTVALVDGTGFVTAVARGTTAITALSEGKSGAAAVTVKAPVDAISIEPAAVTLDVNETAQLTATLRDPDGNVLTRPISWTSGTPAVVQVGASGLLTAQAAGAATVTATSETKSATAAVTVLVPVASVSVTPSVAQLDVGETMQLSATPLDGAGKALNRPVTWGSSDQRVAVVDASGFVTTLAAGTAKISATARGKEGSMILTVLVPVASVGITPATAELGVGETLPLTAVVKDGAGNPLSRPVTWTSSNDALASVDAGGLLAAHAAGSVTVTASAGGKRGQAAIIIRVPVARVNVQPATGVVSVGATLQLTAVAVDANGNPLANRPLTWTSSAATVATVDATGLVTGVAAGSAVINAGTEGHSGTATLTVRVPVARIQVSSPGSEPVPPGGTVKLQVSVFDAAGNPLNDRVVTWSSSDNAVATVDDAGLVTGVAQGTASITAASEGKTASVSIRVAGETTTAGNNLSYPVIFAEGIGITGLPVTEDPGVRPTAEENISVGGLPFFYTGNAPDYNMNGKLYYKQQGPNTWRAQWLDGTSLGIRQADVGWGDNLTSTQFNTHQNIHVEVTLYDAAATPLLGFNMFSLYGSEESEMQGTDGTTAAFTPTIFAVTPRLIVQKLDDATREPVETVFDGSIAEGLGAASEGGFAAEVSVAGKATFGYNLMIQNITLTNTTLHKYGWWRLTFVLDETAQVGGVTISRHVSLARLFAGSGGQIDPATNRSWVDINVKSASGGGGGGE